METDWHTQTPQTPISRSHTERQQKDPQTQWDRTDRQTFKDTENHQIDPALHTLTDSLRPLTSCDVNDRDMSERDTQRDRQTPDSTHRDRATNTDTDRETGTRQKLTIQTQRRIRHRDTSDSHPRTDTAAPDSSNIKTHRETPDRLTDIVRQNRQTCKDTENHQIDPAWHTLTGTRRHISLGHTKRQKDTTHRDTAGHWQRHRDSADRHREKLSSQTQRHIRQTVLHMFQEIVLI